MKIEDFKTGHEREVRKTRIIDGEKEFVIHTDELGGEGSLLDLNFLQGFDTTGLIETLVKRIKPTEMWLENTKYQVKDKQDALKFHEMLIKYYRKHRNFSKEFQSFVIKSDKADNILLKGSGESYTRAIKEGKES